MVTKGAQAASHQAAAELAKHILQSGMVERVSADLCAQLAANSTKLESLSRLECCNDIMSDLP